MLCYGWYVMFLLQLRPTPPHLTSAAAEGLLAQACDNESTNAKRMRMGMEPVAVSVGAYVSMRGVGG